MSDLDIGSLIWISNKKEDSDNIIISHKSDNVLKITLNGCINQDSAKALYIFLEEYKNKFAKPISILIDCRKMSSITKESKYWFTKTFMARADIKRVISFGNNMFIHNTLTVLISFIAKHGNSYINYPTEQDALNAIA